MKPENLQSWLEDVPTEEIDACLEWLEGNGMLNKKGDEFAKEFYFYTWRNPEN